MNTNNIPTIANLGGIVAILVFLWTLHSDVSDLRERMARLEGSFTILAGVLIEKPQE